MQKVLQLDPKDNVLIALTDLDPREPVEFAGTKYALGSKIPAKHKFATRDLPVGSEVIMYGVLVGKTFQPVGKGELLTVGNMRHEAAPYREKAEEYRWVPPEVSRWKGARFLGFRRSDGQVGTRNFWLVVPLVFCENRNILNLKQAFEEELGFARPQLYRQQVAELVRQYGEGKPALIKHRPAQEKGQQADSRRVFRNVDGIKFLLHEGG